MQWMDECALMCATNYAVGPETKAKTCVTVGVDSITFMSPAHVGDQIQMECQVNYTGSSSMEIGCRVTKRNPLKYEGRQRVFSAYLTFVAVDEEGKPTPIPCINPQSEDELRRFDEAAFRVRIRKRAKRALERKFGSWTL